MADGSLGLGRIGWLEVGQGDRRRRSIRVAHLGVNGGSENTQFSWLHYIFKIFSDLDTEEELGILHS